MTKNSIKFYKYFFKGVEKPIIMEAVSRDAADEMMSLLPEMSKVDIDMNLLEDVRIEMPLTGVSKRVRFGKSYIWIGTDKSSDGWMLEDDFKNLSNGSV